MADKWEQLIKSSLKQVKLIDKLDAKIEKESWLWKLYEKTLKVIIDVIFEK